MPRKPSRWTACPECGRDRIGVQPAWNKRPGSPDIAQFQIARHRLADGSFCLGSRLFVPTALTATRADAEEEDADAKGDARELDKRGPVDVS